MHLRLFLRNQQQEYSFFVRKTRIALLAHEAKDRAMSIEQSRAADALQCPRVFRKRPKYRPFATDVSMWKRGSTLVWRSSDCRERPEPLQNLPRDSPRIR